ncbi:12784_t:CDS:1, partial [Entrophospora sp. SA101]
ERVEGKGKSISKRDCSIKEKKIKEIRGDKDHTKQKLGYTLFDKYTKNYLTHSISYPFE